MDSTLALAEVSTAVRVPMPPQPVPQSLTPMGRPVAHPTPPQKQQQQQQFSDSKNPLEQSLAMSYQENIMAPKPPPHKVLQRTASDALPNLVQPELFNGVDTQVDALLGHADDKINRPMPLLLLIARLTSDKFIDYTTMSDFFLTFRMFASSSEVLRLLFSRLAWASQQPPTTSNPERGHDVGVRTFVVIRYWLLNFFADDLLPNVQLRDDAVWAINTLYAMPSVASKPHFVKIMHQLKRTWLAEVCTYWNLDSSAALVTQDLSLPVFAGGPYSTSIGREHLPPSPETASKHRLTLLQFYSDPISPASAGAPVFPDGSGRSSSANDCPAQMGSLVRGGILVDANVAVDAIKTSPQKVRPRKSILHMFSRKRSSMFSPSASRAPPAEAAQPQPIVQPPEKISLEGKVDLLALRTVEELNAMIEARPKPPSPHSEHHSRHSDTLSSAEEFISSFNNDSNDDADTDDNNYDNDDDDDDDHEAEESDSTPRVSAQPQAIVLDRMPGDEPEEETKPVKRDKTYDTLDIVGLRLANTSSDSESEQTDELEEVSDFRPDSIDDGEGQMVVNLRQSSRNWDFDTFANGDIERVSFDGSLSSLSTLSHPSSTDTNIRESLATVRTARRATTRTSVATNTTGGDISLLSEVEGSEMAPCRGFTPQVAMELSAIPDEQVPENEDAILVALQKLEGTYHTQDNRQTMASAVGSFGSTSTLGFYSQAFKSQPDLVEPEMEPDQDQEVSNLAIPDIAALEAAERALHRQQLRNHSGPVVGVSIPAPEEMSSSSSSRPSPTATVPSPSASPLTDVDIAIPSISPAPLSVSTPSHPTLSHTALASSSPRHAPFVLGVSAKDLCNQMTLIERDALDQVDWKELVECRWARTPPSASSWLALLANGELKGVEVVIARFNLVVSWIKSEILLCESPALQAATLSRMIHVARASADVQNYATMVQIVLAVTSTVISELSGVWALVHKDDRDQLRRLERLVSPRHNFSALRRIHKSIDPTKGCIPFTGLYLTDLIYNEQKPSMAGEAINFDKFQTAASLVRSLVQCIEWSKNFSARAQPPLLSKCLYLSTLTDEELNVI